MWSGGEEICNYKINTSPPKIFVDIGAKCDNVHGFTFDVGGEEKDFKDKKETREGENIYI